MHEGPDDIAAMQRTLDESYRRAGRHLRDIHAAGRRPDAGQVASRLAGMCLLSLATTTGDGRPLTGPVDGIFYRGAFHFGSSPDSLRFRHIHRRPWVSATHLPGEEFAVTVHGTARLVDVRDHEHAGLRQTLLDIYLPRYGDMWLEVLDGAAFARIDADRMFAYVAPDAFDARPEHVA